MVKKKLTRREVAAIMRIQCKVEALMDKYNEDEGKDIILSIQGNGSIYSNLSCACAALETILQEY